MCFTALILCTAKVEGHIVCSYSAMMASLTPRKVVVARQNFLNVLGFLVIPSIPNFFKSEFEYHSIILF